MNALELLKQDHRKVAELFDQVEATEAKEAQRQLFGQIKAELETHTHIEETIFYPLLKHHDDLRDLIFEACEEHGKVKTLIQAIEALAKNIEKIDKQIKILGENVKRHVEQEETEMFPKVEDLLSKSDLEELGKRLEAAKSEYQAAA